MSIEEQIISQFQQIRSLPPALGQLGALIKQPAATLQDAEQLICQDAALAARLLTIINHPSSPVERQVENMGQALSLLGMKELYAVLVTDTARSLMHNVSGATVFSPLALWRHSAASALCCRMIAEHIFSQNGYEAYLCGLLHAIGLVPMAENKAADFMRAAGSAAVSMASLLAAEQQILATDHCRVGCCLALQWGLSLELAKAIRDQRQQQANIAPQSLVGILMVSEYIIHKLDLSLIKTKLSPEMAPSLSTYIQDNIEEYSVLAEELPDSLRKMQQIYDD